MRGFEYLMYSTVSFVLLLVLILLPVAPALASPEVGEGAVPEVSEETSAEPEVEEVSTPEEALAPTEDLAIPEDVETAPVEPAPAISEETVAGVLETVVDESGEATVPPQSEESASAETETPSSSEEVVDEGEETINPEETEDTTEETTLPPDTEEDTTPVSDTDVPEDSEEVEDSMPLEEVEEDSVEETIESVGEGGFVVVDSASSDSNPFSFSENECVSVGDGSFYCSTAPTAAVTLGTDRVFSAVDADGDKEIYIEKGGELTTITENLLDDDAPYYDELSETIVWHRLIDGRYQIVSFDLAAEEETVLTNDRYNNMEPSRYGDITVWQGWIGNDWEIMLEENGEITMLTDNTYNDVAPNVNGTYIVWQSFEESAWRVKVYDTITGEITTIDDAEGASAENPRFVLVYDSKQENGDVETRGYDLEERRAVPLGATPAPIPESIPDPDQTGEDRALLQTVTQVKPKGEGESDAGGDIPPPVDDLGTTTPEDISDVVIPPLDEVPSGDEDIVLPDTEDTGTPVSDSIDPVSHIEDVVVTEVPVLEDTSATDHIEDVIVTPFVEPIEELEVVQLD